MSLQSLTELDQFKAKESPFAPGYNPTSRTFYSPTDDVPGVLKALLASADKSLVLAMYGYDSADLDAIIHEKLRSAHVYVQMTLDSSQAAGKAEKAILATWDNNLIGNSIAIGQSEKHAIMHLKMVIVDGLDVVDGSTNWSLGGTTRQDNQLTVTRDPLRAAEARARIDIIHDAMLKALAAKQGG